MDINTIARAVIQHPHAPTAIYLGRLDVREVLREIERKSYVAGDLTTAPVMPNGAEFMLMGLPTFELRCDRHLGVA